MEITKEKKVDKFQDMAEKWRVTIDLGNGESKMLKFQKDPTLAEIEEIINKPTKVIDNLIEIEEIRRQIIELQEEIIRLEEENNAITNTR